MIPTLGRIVHYTLNESDVRIIGQRRIARQRILGEYCGNPVRPGDVFPAIITRVWDEQPTEESVVQLQVFLDGVDQAWASSAHQGNGEGQWRAPRVLTGYAVSPESFVPVAPQTDGPLHQCPTEIKPGIVA